MRYMIKNKQGRVPGGLYLSESKLVRVKKRIGIFSLFRNLLTKTSVGSQNFNSGINFELSMS